jgi:hypothetical protein
MVSRHFTCLSVLSIVNSYLSLSLSPYMSFVSVFINLYFLHLTITFHLSCNLLYFLVCLSVHLTLGSSVLFSLHHFESVRFSSSPPSICQSVYSFVYPICPSSFSFFVSFCLSLFFYSSLWVLFTLLPKVQIVYVIERLFLFSLIGKLLRTIN